MFVRLGGGRCIPHRAASQGKGVYFSEAGVLVQLYLKVSGIVPGALQASVSTSDKWT